MRRSSLRGDEDLGGGTHAIFDLQSGFNLNNGAQSAAGLIFNRQAFVGLRNDHYGTMTAGRQYTPYFLFVGPYASSSWLTGATGAHPGDIDGSRHDDTREQLGHLYVADLARLTASAMYASAALPARPARATRSAPRCVMRTGRSASRPATCASTARPSAGFQNPATAASAASRYPC